MNVYIDTPYQVALTKPLVLSSGYYKHQHPFCYNITIRHNGQHFILTWDEERNALRIISDNKLNIEPSSANGILIQDTKN